MYIGRVDANSPQIDIQKQQYSNNAQEWQNWLTRYNAKRNFLLTKLELKEQ